MDLDRLRSGSGEEPQRRLVGVTRGLTGKLVDKIGRLLTEIDFGPLLAFQNRVVMGGQPPGAMTLYLHKFDGELQEILDAYKLRLNRKRRTGEKVYNYALMESLVDVQLVKLAFHDEKLRDDYKEIKGRDPLAISPNDARHKCKGFGINCQSCKYEHLCSYSLCMTYEPSDQEKDK